MNPQTPYERVVAALQAAGSSVHPNGQTAQCPAHEDHTPSLSITEKDDGTILLHCHAGCPPNAVLSALNLTLTDLYPTRPHTADVVPFSPRRIVATYPYTDEGGQILFEVVRYEPKGFRQRQPDGAGGWTWNVNGIRRPLWRLPNILDAVKTGDTIWIAEGEKDVLALEAAGVTATTNPGGAGKWQPEHTQTLAGATVIIVADRDSVGQQHARHVASELAGVATSVRILQPAEGKDIADHLAAGLTLDALQPVDIEDIDDGLPQPIDWPDFWALSAAAEDWLVEPLIPAGRGIALIAQYKTGKSLLALHIAYALATGQALFDRPASDPVHVSYLDWEMTAADLRDRLESLGATETTDLSHLHYYQPAQFPPLDSPEGGAALTAAVERDQSQLVIIDTHGRSTMGEDHASDTMRAVWRHCGGPLKAAGVTWIRLDHVGHTDKTRARGSSAKGEDIDLMWVMRETDRLNVFTLTATSRTNWIPAELTLTREDTNGALTHSLVNLQIPEGVNDCAADLDALAVPLDVSSREAEKMLRQAGKGRRRIVLLAALKRRKAQGNQSGTVGTNPQATSPGTTQEQHGTPPEGTGETPPQEPGRHHPEHPLRPAVPRPTSPSAPPLGGAEGVGVDADTTGIEEF